MIEFHTESFTDDESANELNELVGTDVDELYNILGEMRDDAWIVQFYWWRCNLPWVAGCYLHRNHRGFGISFLLQFSPS